MSGWESGWESGGMLSERNGRSYRAMMFADISASYFHTKDFSQQAPAAYKCNDDRTSRRRRKDLPRRQHVRRSPRPGGEVTGDQQPCSHCICSSAVLGEPQPRCRGRGGLFTCASPLCGGAPPKVGVCVCLCGCGCVCARARVCVFPRC